MIVWAVFQVSLFTASPPVDERRLEVKYAATVQNGTDVSLFSRVPGMQYYFEIYVTLEQNINCLVYRERILDCK